MRKSMLGCVCCMTTLGSLCLCSCTNATSPKHLATSAFTLGQMSAVRQNHIGGVSHDDSLAPESAAISSIALAVSEGLRGKDLVQVIETATANANRSFTCELICPMLQLGDQLAWQYVLETCSDVNATSCEGEPLLIYAIINNNRQLFDLLLQKKAEVNFLHNDVSPLSYAFLQPNLSMARDLYLAGADPKLTGGNRPDAIQTANLVQIVPLLEADPVLRRMLNN